MTFGRKSSRRLGFIAGLCSMLTRKKPPKDTGKTDFSTSTQRMGVRFTEKIRTAFRAKWIKKSQ